MDIRIVKETNNPLFRRKEVQFEIKHPDSATPDRIAIRQALASKMRSEVGLVYVLDAVTATGTERTIGRADVYQDAQQSAKVVPEHILTRNLPPEERAKRVAEKKEKKPQAEAPPAKPAEKPSKPKEEKPEKAVEKQTEKEKS